MILLLQKSSDEYTATSANNRAHTVFILLGVTNYPPSNFTSNKATLLLIIHCTIFVVLLWKSLEKLSNKINILQNSIERSMSEDKVSFFNYHWQMMIVL